MNYPTTRGFTLIEISIVMVIVALIAAGIVVGRDMITNANRVKTASQVEKVITAVKAFKLKYNGLPGDLTNATQIWGVHSGFTGTHCDSNGSVAESQAWNAAPYEIGTCNGDGNGIIYGSWMGWERLVFWQHLSNAELIPQKLKGGRLAGSGAALITAHVNVPATSLPMSDHAGGPAILAINPATQTTVYPPYSSTEVTNMLTQQNNIIIASAYNNNNVYDGIFPVDALWLDTKLDDGNAVNGKMRGTVSGLCANSSGVYYASYPYYNCTLLLMRPF